MYIHRKVCGGNPHKLRNVSPTPMLAVQTAFPKESNQKMWGGFAPFLVCLVSPQEEAA